MCLPNWVCVHFTTAALVLFRVSTLVVVLLSLVSVKPISSRFVDLCLTFYCVFLLFFCMQRRRCSNCNRKISLMFSNSACKKPEVLLDSSKYDICIAPQVKYITCTVLYQITPLQRHRNCDFVTCVFADTYLTETVVKLTAARNYTSYRCQVYTGVYLPHNAVCILHGNVKLSVVSCPVTDANVLRTCIGCMVGGGILGIGLLSRGAMQPRWKKKKIFA